MKIPDCFGVAISSVGNLKATYEGEILRHLKVCGYDRIIKKVLKPEVLFIVTPAKTITTNEINDLIISAVTKRSSTYVYVYITDKTLSTVEINFLKETLKDYVDMTSDNLLDITKSLCKDLEKVYL